MLINKMFYMYWLDLQIGCLGSAVLYQQVSDFLICSSRPPSLPHNTLTVFLLGSECKAITHWRVCLNHTEWLWILNAGLGPTEEQAHGRDSVSWVLIWLKNILFFPPFLQNSSGNTLLAGKIYYSCFSPSAAPPNQTTAWTNTLSKRKLFDHYEHPVEKKELIEYVVGQPI